MAYKKLGLFLVTVMVLKSCSSSPLLPSAEDLQVTKLAQSEGFRIPTAGRFVIRDAPAYEAFSEKYWERTTPAPSVDFEKEMLIAVFYGENHSGCQNEVEVIRSVRTLFTSTIIDVGPLPDLGDCDAVIAPHHMVTVPAQSGFDTFTGDVPDIQAKPVAFETLANFDKFFVPQPGIQTYKDEASWLALWEESWTESDENGRTPPPEVDFTKDMVLAVYYGDGFSGCDQGVDLIESIEETCPVICDDNQLLVRLKPLPEDLGGCRQAIAPLTMVVIPKTDLPLITTGPSPN